MPVQSLVTPEKYLHMVFDGRDCEYVDGEIIERGMPTLEHGTAQARFIEIVFTWKQRGVALIAIPELRNKLSATRFRIPDIAIFERDTAGMSVPDFPPLVAIEIISPDDKFVETIDKLQEYSDFGVRHIWVGDPVSKSFFVYTSNQLRASVDFAIPEYQLTISKQEFFL